MLTNCRSCGRNIASGTTIRCAKCSTPFHLSCSHRYKISPEGVFNVCCGPTNAPFPNNRVLPMRTRNKRRRQNNLNNDANNQLPLPSTETMVFEKIQKIDQSMVIEEKPHVCEEVTVQEDFIELDNDNVNEFETTNEEPPLSNVNELDDQQTININNKLNSDNKVTLETVWQGISSLQSSISNISHSLDSVSSQLNTFDPRINELEASLNTIKTKTSNLENVQNDVSGLRNELQQVTQELESLKSIQTDQSLNINISEIFSEIRQREIKSKNIIIYNVPEDNLRISQDYSTIEDINKFNALVAARDNSRAREILENIPNLDLDELDTKRLGRANSNMIRPLRVTLPSRDDVIIVMKNRRLVNSQYNVKTDLTKHQQERIKQLKQQLEKMNGRQGMTIKFINGEPKIIPIQRFGMKNE